VLVLVGVAVCTVTDVSVNSQGLLAAVIAVWSTALQQHVSIVDIKTCPLLFIYLYMTSFPNWSYPSLAPIFIAWLLI
jgi:hypothetical protein